MAIEGGAIASKGLLRFVVTTTNNTVFLSCYSQPAGHELLSFRSEACIFLAAIRIIFLIAEHYNESMNDSIVITSKICLYTDSLNMFKNFNLMNKYPIAHLKYLLTTER